MYSLVLMTALTAGAEAPTCHWHTASYSSCCGGCCGGYSYGCCGGCCGGYSYSCCGGYGSGCYGCGGCCGGNYHGYHNSLNGSYGCGSCCGGACYSYGCYGTFTPYLQVFPPATTTPAIPPAEQMPTPKKASDDKSGASNRARLVIDVAADTKLFIDDQPMKSGTPRRSFSTPALEQGQTYYYMLRAETTYNGKTYSETKRVLVRSGEVVKASFSELDESLAAAKSAVQVGAR